MRGKFACFKSPPVIQAITLLKGSNHSSQQSLVKWGTQHLQVKCHLTGVGTMGCFYCQWHPWGYIWLLLWCLKDDAGLRPVLFQNKNKSVSNKEHYSIKSIFHGVTSSFFCNMTLHAFWMHWIWNIVMLYCSITPLYDSTEGILSCTIMYSGENKYLIHCQFCRFSYLQSM
jgi:hypothetical protein